MSLRLRKSGEPLRMVRSRVTSWLWTARGRVALARGNLSRALTSLEVAATARPGAYKTLILLARAYLEARETWRAHRTLAQAREVDPGRFARDAARWLESGGYEREVLRTVLSGTILRQGWGAKVAPSPRSAASPSVAVRDRRVRRVTARSHPYGDCASLDEYARFRAMPRISRAEIEATDWDSILEDLLED